MADKFIEIDIQNEHEVIRHLELVEQRNQHKTRELIEELSKFTENMLTIMVPTYNLYIFRHIAREGPVWMPGGPGGGGEWKSIIGIKDGPSRHPEYVEFGTGIYGSKGGLIFPHSREGLAFRKRGEGGGKPIVRRWVRGQRPQRYFYLTWGVLRALARERIAERNLFN